MLLENIWRSFVGNVQMNISTSNIFPNMLLDKRFHQNYQAVLAALSINGLRAQTYGPCWEQMIWRGPMLNRNRDTWPDPKKLLLKKSLPENFFPPFQPQSNKKTWIKHTHHEKKKNPKRKYSFTYLPYFQNKCMDRYRKQTIFLGLSLWNGKSKKLPV